VNTAGPIVFAFIMLLLGAACIWRPGIVQSYSVWSLQVGRGRPPRSSLEFAKSPRYLLFLRVFGILPLSVGVCVIWILLRQ
jgi:hypothetical protein